jgi:glycine betaine/proline transport system permease protein
MSTSEVSSSMSAPVPVTLNASQERTEQLVQAFVGSSGSYYQQQFERLGEAPGFRWTINVMAALFGPIWFAARGLWSWFFCLLLLEGFAWVQIINGLLGDRGREQRERAQSILRTLTTRKQQLEEAISTGASNVEAFKRTVDSLQQALSEATAKADLASQSGLSLIILGAVLVLLCHSISSICGNWALENRFTRWRSNRSLPSGLSWPRAFIGVAILVIVAGLTGLRYARPELVPLLNDFPTQRSVRLDAANAIKAWFDWAKQAGDGLFGSIVLTVRHLLDGLEVLFVGTPWPVVMLIVGMLGWLSAGPRVAIFCLAALSYLGVLGFWEKAMTTISLLGAAALVSISLGIPLGIYCARRPKVYSFVRPVLDFMQSMPSFVYLIPVVAFFGAGKPAAIVATLIFGSPPVIRLTVLGLQQVPTAIREAAQAFGASPRYLLFKVDLPLAAKTIMAGVNQTILLSLAMVVVASLIGAKGLGEEVLEALQYASEGQGILAGLAILCCALILDRIVQGRTQEVK